MLVVQAVAWNQLWTDAGTKIWSALSLSIVLAKPHLWLIPPPPLSPHTHPPLAPTPSFPASPIFWAFPPPPIHHPPNPHISHTNKKKEPATAEKFLTNWMEFWGGKNAAAVSYNTHTNLKILTENCRAGSGSQPSTAVIVRLILEKDETSGSPCLREVFWFMLGNDETSGTLCLREVL